MDTENGINTRGELYAALAAARLEFADIVKSKTAKVKSEKAEYSYKYADLSSIIEATAEPLAKHGLSLIQEPEVINEGGRMVVIVHGTIAHKSGATYQLRPLPMPVQQTTPQGIGSAISYARRYQCVSAFNLAADDDDGQGAKGETKETAKPAKPAPEPQRQPQAQPAAHRTPAPQVKSEPELEPTEFVWQTWPNVGAAWAWAVEIGACGNKFEAENSWNKIKENHGGKLTAENSDAIRKAYYERQQDKLAEKQTAPVAA